MTRSPEIVVVGAGILGASIAYHLARRGAQVTVIDKAGPAAGATGVSWAWLNASHPHARPYFELRHRSMGIWREMQEQIGRKLSIDWSGSLLWELDDDALAAFVRRHASWGYDVRLLDEAAIRTRESLLRQPPRCAALAPCEGALDPVETTNVLLTAARRAGARTLFETLVTGLMMRGGRVTGVRTTSQTLAADIVVLAVGTAMSEICGQVDVPLPMAPKPGVMSWLWTEQPLVSHVIINRDLMIKQLNPNVIVAEQTRSHRPDTDEPEAEGQWVQALIAEQFRHGDQVRLMRTALGIRPIPADGLPAQGFAGGVEGLYLAVMHSGVTLAAAAGRFAAAEILDDVAVELLAPFRPARFAG